MTRVLYALLAFPASFMYAPVAPSSFSLERISDMLPFDGVEADIMKCNKFQAALPCGKTSFKVSGSTVTIRAEASKILRFGITYNADTNSFHVPTISPAVNKTSSADSRLTAMFVEGSWTHWQSQETSSSSENFGSIYLGLDYAGRCLLVGEFFIKTRESMLLEDSFILRYPCGKNTHISKRFDAALQAPLLPPALMGSSGQTQIARN